MPSGMRGADIAMMSEPSAGIDGDFLIFNRFSDSCFDLIIGDGMGKGVPAALIYVNAGHTTGG